MHNIASHILNADAKSLVLRSEEAKNLFYIVELEQNFEDTIILYKGENYRQACYVAKKAFEWLVDNTSEPFEIISEQQQGRGVTYTYSCDVKSFPTSLENEEEDIYMMMCDEFSHQQIYYMHDLNLLFRKFVNKFKLNEYQEHKFLKKLKELGYV